jgi:hypothetical protein
VPYLRLRAMLGLLALVSSGCLPGGQSGGSSPPGGSEVPGAADLTGTLTWTLNSRESDPASLNLHGEKEDTAVLNFVFDHDEARGWVDVGSSFTREGSETLGDDLCEKERSWSGGGLFADSEGSYLEVFVDEEAGIVDYDSYVEADMTGTATCDPTSFSQGGAEWVEIATCGRDMGTEVFTGEPHGVIGADGRTVTFNCKAVVDDVLNETGTVHEEWTVTGQLLLAP